MSSLHKEKVEFFCEVTQLVLLMLEKDWAKFRKPVSLRAVLCQFVKICIKLMKIILVPVAL